MSASLLKKQSQHSYSFHPTSHLLPNTLNQHRISYTFLKSLFCIPSHMILLSFRNQPLYPTLLYYFCAKFDLIIQKYHFQIFSIVAHNTAWRIIYCQSDYHATIFQDFNISLCLQKYSLKQDNLFFQ